VYADSDFHFNQTVSGVGSQSGSTSRDPFLPGGFVSGNFSVGLTDSLSVFAGAQFQNVGEFTQIHRASGQKAVLDLSESIFVTVGLSWSF
jgi:hypothetical protein